MSTSEKRYRIACRRGQCLLGPRDWQWFMAVGDTTFEAQRSLCDEAIREKMRVYTAWEYRIIEPDAYGNFALPGSEPPRPGTPVTIPEAAGIVGPSGIGSATGANACLHPADSLTAENWDLRRMLHHRDMTDAQIEAELAERRERREGSGPHVINPEVAVPLLQEAVSGELDRLLDESERRIAEKWTAGSEPLGVQHGLIPPTPSPLRRFGEEGYPPETPQEGGEALKDEPLILENEFTWRELDVLRELSERQELTRTHTIRQALRIYQTIVLGHSKLVEVNPLPKSLSESDGVVATVVIVDPQAHRELIELCQKWHRQKSNSMYIDGEQSLYSYREENKTKNS